MYLANAFSLNMIPADVDELIVHIERIGPGDVPADTESVIGHPDTARIVSDILDRDDVTANRVSVTVNPGDTLYVAQYRGPRLPVGATELPDGATITFYRVTIR